MKAKRRLALAALALLVAGLAVAVLFRGGGKPVGEATEPSAPALLPDAARKPVQSGEAADAEASSPEPEPVAETDEPEPPMTDEEKREAEEAKLVDEFDNLTDAWREPKAKGVSMADVEHFAKTFRRLPKARRDECIHRALNLVPDENVMLLAGVLMDREMDREIVETVFNDILNRFESVKKPILQQVFKDKSHPCWADTAWILDVTGEIPKKQ